MTTTPQPRTVALVGSTGVMGALAESIIADHPDFEVHARLRSGSSLDEIDGADLVFDATRLDVSTAVVRHSVERGIPVLVATSGWARDQVDMIRPLVESTAGATVAIVPNFSVGSVVGTAIATIAARFFPRAEIIEVHGDTKPDSPSGTAIRTAEQVDAALGSTEPPPWAGQPARGDARGAVSVHALRLPGAPDEQTVRFASAHESLQVIHAARSFEAYRPGVAMSLAAMQSGLGLVVGMENLVDLGLPTAVRGTR